MDWQTEVMLETILGHGVDIHLLGLQQTALMQGKTMPAIFEDPTYKKANWFRLSTSQVDSNSFIMPESCIRMHVTNSIKQRPEAI